jgi:hypothetical protein
MPAIAAGFKYAKANLLGARAPAPTAADIPPDSARRTTMQLAADDGREVLLGAQIERPQSGAVLA